MKRHSFTLVELMAVIAIVAILAGILLGGVSFAQNRAREAQTIARMEQFQIALEAFRADYGFYPMQAAGDVDFSHTSENTTWDLFTNYTPNKRGKAYMEGIHGSYGKFLDGYGEPFQYEYPAAASRNTTKFALWSKGSDGSNGTDDDICSWKQK